MRKALEGACYMTTKKKKSIAWEDLEKEIFTPERIKANQEWADKELAKLELKELRTAAGVTQVELAKAMKVAQAEVSAMEHRRDHKVSTLKKVVKALGGELEVIARFKGKVVKLSV